MTAVPFLDSAKRGVRKQLPQQLESALNSYGTFARSPPPEDAKGFASYHSACKSALSHIDQLLKLAQWIEDKETNTSSPLTERSETDDLLTRAHQAVAIIEDFDE